MFGTTRKAIPTALAVLAVAPGATALAVPAREAPSSVHGADLAPVVQSVESGFDWGAAGIGAGGTLMIVALVAGSGVMVLPSRRPGHSVPAR